MAWVAKVKDKEKNEDGSVRLVILITDNDKIKKIITYIISRPSQTIDWLKDQIRSEIANLKGLDPLVTGISNGVIEL